MKLLPIACLALFSAGCATTTATAPAAPTAPAAQAPRAASAQVNLAPASGSLVSGRLAFMPMGNGVHLRGDIGGLAPGSAHGIHVHETGDCSAADASSAGGHFNPTGQPHGDRMENDRHHAGDLPNITAGSDGVAHVDMHINGLTLGGPAATSILGRALVVHAAPDDYVSQPAGNSGARIACGVIAAQR